LLDLQWDQGRIMSAAIAFVSDGSHRLSERGISCADGLILKL
jgi:hypothetical protein